MIFAGSHILSIDQFERDDINRIFSVADLMEPYAQRKKMTKVLDGAILGSMFFEPSTRTRVSFGCAFNLLGGEVRETTGFEHTAIAKGESLYDTARVMSGYSDAIVMRHPQAWSVAEFASANPSTNIIWRTSGHYAAPAPRNPKAIYILEANKQAVEQITNLGIKNLVLADWGGALFHRSFGPARIKGDLAPHYGLEGRLVMIQLIANKLIELTRMLMTH